MNMNKLEIKAFILRLHTVFMIVLVSLAVLMLFGMFIGSRPRILVTSSMEPDIPKNSLVLIDTSRKWTELEEGNAIVFRANKTEVLHRVREIRENELIVTPDKGTGSAIVNKSMYVGKEIIAFPLIGGWLREILMHEVWTVIGLAMLLIFIGCLPYKK